MVTNIDQLKKLIEWCKDNKIKRLKMGEVEFEISELDFIPQETGASPLGPQNTGEFNTDTLVDTAEDKPITEDEDLYYSSGT